MSVRGRTGQAFFFFLLAAAACPAAAFAGESLYFQSGRTQNTLVELYTSDINSDCNAALAWMSALAAEDPKGLWKDFVPVVMHVSLWDVPGGKDVFAKKAFDDFLMRYKKLWGVNRLHAPAVVVNGTEWGGWAHGRDVPKVLPKEMGVLSADARKSRDRFLVEFIPSKKIDADGLTVHGALLGFGVESRPAQGGNRDRTLSHDFVVLAYAAQSFHLSYGVLSASLELSRKKTRAKKYGAVFWVTPRGDVKPLQAVGGYLP